MLKITVLTIIASSSFAFAGPEERAAKAEAETAVKAAVAAYKTSCGCSPKFDVKWDAFKTADQINKIKNTAESITSESGAYCADAGAKKAMCAVKSIEYTVGGSSEAKFAGGKLSITTDGTSYAGWTMITPAVDK